MLYIDCNIIPLSECIGLDKLYKGEGIHFIHKMVVHQLGLTNIALDVQLN